MDTCYGCRGDPIHDRQAHHRAVTEELLPKRRSEIAVSQWASRLGAVYAAGIAVLSVYAAGLILNQTGTREVGLLGIRILCDTELVCNPLKIITERPRPTEKSGSGQFWKGGYGFPSGHSMKIWALASGLIHEFPQQRIIRALAYGIAGTVSLSRIFGFRHFASDAFVGAVTGWYIGAFVQRRHRSGAYLRDLYR